MSGPPVSRENLERARQLANGIIDVAVPGGESAELASLVMLNMVGELEWYRSIETELLLRKRDNGKLLAAASEMIARQRPLDGQKLNRFDAESKLWANAYRDVERIVNVSKMQPERETKS